jgi:hypothetical protein
VKRPLGSYHSAFPVGGSATFSFEGEESLGNQSGEAFADGVSACMLVMRSISSDGKVKRSEILLGQNTLPPTE